MRIVFYIEALRSGGKERRLLELIHYLKKYNNYEIAVVLTKDEIHYDYVHDLGVSLKVIKRKGLKKDPRVFKEFYRYCALFRPDIIHTWGYMNTFYAIPTKLILKVPLISSMITTSRNMFKPFSLGNIFFKLSCLFSDIIVSNSFAGLKEFRLKSSKARVIYNGVRMERFRKDFDNIALRQSIGMNTVYMVVMVASFSRLKDYDLFLDIAIKVSEHRNDVTFVAVGDGNERSRIENRIVSEMIPNVILAGRRKDVESIVSASDIGLLFTNTELHGEGISNSIIEYMALGKPVISTDFYGGSKEIIVEGKTGYCVEKNVQRITELVLQLLENGNMRMAMGLEGKARIEEHFSLERMGNEFDNLYKEFVD